MKRHVIKFEYEDGNKVVLWCGRVHDGRWIFKDTGEVALAVGGSVAPCKNCIKSIIKELEKVL